MVSLWNHRSPRALVSMMKYTLLWLKFLASHSSRSTYFFICCLTPRKIVEITRCDYGCCKSLIEIKLFLLFSLLCVYMCVCVYLSLSLSGVCVCLYECVCVRVCMHEKECVCFHNKFSGVRFHLKLICVCVCLSLSFWSVCVLVNRIGNCSREQ